tara:strand:- start:1298 stop:1522 length:225 start_codon:yes stop_codon:yes gene_type:complete
MGGLFGSPAAPVIREPIKAITKAKTNSLDPNQEEGIENAKRKRAAASSRSGRKNLRVDLATTKNQPRAGISIGK